MAFRRTRGRGRRRPAAGGASTHGRSDRAAHRTARPLPAEFREDARTAPAGTRDLYQFYDSLGGGPRRHSDRAAAEPRRFTPAEIDPGATCSSTLLSGDRTLSCASCHLAGQGPERRLAALDRRARPGRGSCAPTLWNVAFLQSFFWDARAHTLEEQADRGSALAAEGDGQHARRSCSPA